MGVRILFKTNLKFESQTQKCKTGTRKNNPECGAQVQVRYANTRDIGIKGHLKPLCWARSCRENFTWMKIGADNGSRSILMLKVMIQEESGKGDNIVSKTRMLWDEF